MSPVGTSSGSPGEGPDALPPCVPCPITLLPPRLCLRGALGLERGCISLSPTSPEDQCLLPGDSLCGEEAPPCPSVRPLVWLRATGVDYSPWHPLCPLLRGRTQASHLPGAFQGKFECPLQASRGLMGSVRSLRATDGALEGLGGQMGPMGPPGNGGTELVLSAPMDSLLWGHMGTIIFFTLYHSGSRWTFYFCFKWKIPLGGVPLPQINPGDFFEGGIERQGLGGTCWPGEAPLPSPW